MLKKIVRVAWAMAAAATLAACNGGGGAAPGSIATNFSISSNGTLPPFFAWMSREVQDAWRAGFFGQGTSIIVVDDYRTNSTFTANFGTGQLTQRHGDFTRLQASLIAPQATITTQDVARTTPLTLGSGLNILNLSYGLPSLSRNTSLGTFQQSLSDHGNFGRAVVVKSAGNNSVPIDGPNSSGEFDLMNLSLLQGCNDGCSSIFVGALTSNGTVANPASIATYSNTPGTNTTAQQRYLMVGVLSSETGIAGTSFAAPIVSGYAAILGSKFPSATPTQIANQLLNTARTDTIRNYNVQTHGRGEASLANALAPMSLQ